MHACVRRFVSTVAFFLRGGNFAEDILWWESVAGFQQVGGGARDFGFLGFWIEEK